MLLPLEPAVQLLPPLLLLPPEPPLLLLLLEPALQQLPGGACRWAHGRTGPVRGIPGGEGLEGGVAAHVQD